VAVIRWTDPAAMDGFNRLAMAALGRENRDDVNYSRTVRRPWFMVR